MSEGQLFLIGIAASLILSVLNALASLGWKPTREVVAIALYVIAFALAAFFSGFVMPIFGVFTDAPSFVLALLAYIGQLLEVSAPIVGMAYLVYNLLLKRVEDRIARYHDVGWLGTR